MRDDGLSSAPSRGMQNSQPTRNRVSRGATISYTHTDGSPTADIRGIRLVNLDKNSDNSTDSDSDDAGAHRNKDIFLLKEHDSVLIGRAPQASRSARFPRTSGQGGRTIPANSWVHPSPVLSRSHAVLKLSKDKVSAHAMWHLVTRGQYMLKPICPLGPHQ